MNVKLSRLQFPGCLLLVCFSINIHAENWVNLYSENDGFPFLFDIDSDSIRKGSDGLVYFHKKQDGEIYTSAINCKKNIYYAIDGDKEWRSNGVSIEPGNEYVIEAEYVCSKA